MATMRYPPIATKRCHLSEYANAGAYPGRRSELAIGQNFQSVPGTSVTFPLADDGMHR